MCAIVTSKSQDPRLQQPGQRFQNTGSINCHGSSLSYSPNHPTASCAVFQPIKPTTSHQSSRLRLTPERSPAVKPEASEYRADESVKLMITSRGNRSEFGSFEVVKGLSCSVDEELRRVCFLLDILVEMMR